MAIERNHIDKVFSQKFSFLDQANLVKNFEDNSLNEEAKDLIKEQWKHFNPNHKYTDTSLDHVFYKICYTINNKNDFSSQRNHLFIRISQIAAILIVGLLISTSIYWSAKSGENGNTQQVEFISHNGFRNQFKLPDGTTGWLGYNSKLIYYVNKNKQRIVDLNGLAFFDVQHKKMQPFIVNTPTKLNIEVLGTRFNVSSYTLDNSCEIVLEQGSVKLNLQDRKVGVMIPNDRVIFHLDDNSIVKSNINVSEYLAWKDGKLILNDVSLKEACIKLSRFYNVEFELNAGGVDNQKVRLVLEDETIEDALKLLTMIVPVKWQVAEREILDNNSYSKKKILIKNK